MQKNVNIFTLIYLFKSEIWIRSGKRFRCREKRSRFAEGKIQLLPQETLRGQNLNKNRDFKMKRIFFELENTIFILELLIILNFYDLINIGFNFK